MMKMIIKDINGYNYTLKDKQEKEYKINIEFYGIKNNPMINDVIYINEKLLHETETKIVSFGPLNEKYGKTISPEDEDIIVLSIENQNIFLKRFYG